jgi:hypothetical protein
MEYLINYVVKIIYQLLYGYIAVDVHLGGVDVHTYQEYAFRKTCGNGHLSVVKWLYGFGGVNIHLKNDEAFREACHNGHLSMAQWLRRL